MPKWEREQGVDDNLGLLGAGVTGCEQGVDNILVLLRAWAGLAGLSGLGGRGVSCTTGLGGGGVTCTSSPTSSGTEIMFSSSESKTLKGVSQIETLRGDIPEIFPNERDKSSLNVESKSWNEVFILIDCWMLISLQTDCHCNCGKNLYHNSVPCFPATPVTVMTPTVLHYCHLTYNDTWRLPEGWHLLI